MKRSIALALVALASACGPTGENSSSQELTQSGPSWPQWGQNAQHTGFFNVVGQALGQNLVNRIYDPLTRDEMANNVDPAGYYGKACTADADCGSNEFCVLYPGTSDKTCLPGDLLAHFQAPLVDGNDVFMEEKGNTYSTNSYSTQKWCETKFTWIDDHLVEQWDFMSDWKAPGSVGDFWEPVFHPALANGYLYVPGANGTLLKVRRSDGSLAARIDPFHNNNNNVFVVSPITVDAAGNLYYTALQLNGSSSSTVVTENNSRDAQSGGHAHGERAGAAFVKDALDSWLVKVTPGDGISTVSFLTLTPGAPGKNDDCLTAFNDPYPSAGGDPLPWPPSNDAAPPTIKCGIQRAAVNAAPAIAPDGTIYVISKAHLVTRYNYMVAVNPDLTPKWASSMRDRFNDGCGVPFSAGGVLPPNGTPGGCRPGASYGVDPTTNRPGAGRVLDDSSSSPVVAPDGSVIYGAHSRYNWAQGHLMHWDKNGGYMGSFLFGWDVTPAIRPNGSTYSVIIKENHYGSDPGACAWNSDACFGSYCYNPNFCPSDRSADALPDDPERYYVTQLDAGFNVQWRYQAVNHDSCVRDASGNVSCALNTHPAGFEWCVNAPVVDAKGVVYANSEDGWLYAIKQGGALRDKIFQQLAVGAAYTPTSLGADGRIYSQNAGHLFVVTK
jgi:hypothetical protein